MKNFLTILFVLFQLVAFSQDLERLIPANADAVVEINGEHIFDLISVSDIERFMTSDAMRMAGESFDIGQFGFNPNAKAYYFYQKQHKIGYQTVIVEIANPQKAAETIAMQLPEPATEMLGYQVGMSMPVAAAWNDHIAVLSMVEVPKEEYTMDDLIAEYEAEREQKNDEDDEETEEEDTFPTEMDLRMKNMMAPFIYSDAKTKEYVQDHILSIINKQTPRSIANVSSYQNGKEDDAVAYIWVNNIDKMISKSMVDYIPAGLPMHFNPEKMLWMNALTSNLKFGEDDIQLNTAFEIDQELVPIYEKMQKSKLDKSFLKYIDVSDMIGYMSLTTDTRRWLEEYPEMVRVMYGSMLPEAKEEIGLGADLMSIILDEEAIGRMITGDAVFVLHDLQEQEVTFKSYDYDEDYNPIEVEKTKMQPIPTFTFMFGSEDKQLIKKLMRIGVKHKMAENTSGYYKVALEDKQMPFDVYMTVVDDVVLVTNSNEKIGRYSLGKSTCNLGSHKKILRNNMFNFYVNSEKAYDMMSEMIPMGGDHMEGINRKFPEMYMSMGKMKGNKVHYNLKVKTKGNKSNALKLIMSSMEEAKAKKAQAESDKI